MKPSDFLPCAVTLGLFFSVESVFASPSPGEGEAAEPQVVSGLALPYWEEGECRENFEIRIWPQSVVIWLEEEQLRSLIADPATPNEERQSLRRLLALQRAWRAHG